MRMTYEALCLVAAIAFVGCEKKETLLDIETPRGEVEVERDPDSGDISVEAERTE